MCEYKLYEKGDVVAVVASCSDTGAQKVAGSNPSSGMMMKNCNHGVPVNEPKSSAQKYTIRDD